MFNETGRKLHGLYQALSNSEARFRSLIEHSSDVIMTLDEKGTIRYASPSSVRVLGLRSSEMVEKRILQFVAAAGPHGAFVVPEQGATQTIELSFRRDDDRTVVLEAMVSNLLHEPAVSAVVVNARDVTDRKRAEQEAKLAYSQLTKELSERKRAEAEIKLLSARLMNAEEEERRKIARELHDDFGQQIAALSLFVSKWKRDLPEGEVLLREREVLLRERMDQLYQRLLKLADGVRNLSHELHPAVLEHSGIAAALRSYCSEFMGMSGVNVTVDTEGTFTDLSPAMALCIYRIAQEALQNVARHSGSKDARVELRRSDGNICFVVVDSGRGFDSERARAKPGLGLVSMKERARLVHGTVHVESEPNRGTKLRVLIPLAGSAE